MQKTNILVIPLWKIDLKNGLSYICFGNTQFHAMNIICNHMEVRERDIDWVSSISNTDAKNILIQPDQADDDDEFVTLYEEALFWQNTDDYSQFSVTNFEIIADLTI